MQNLKCGSKFNKERDMIDFNGRSIKVEILFLHSPLKKTFATTQNTTKFKYLLSILKFAHKVEGILSNTMVKPFQSHFSLPLKLAQKKAHVNLTLNFIEGKDIALSYSEIQNFKFEGEGSSPPI
jgi:hypothetical protein